MNFKKVVEMNPEKYPARMGQLWEEDEIKKLLSEASKGTSHDDIAKIHERTVGSIRSKLRDIAADYYYNNEMPVDKIKKYTGLPVESIADAIARRAQRDSQKESKPAKKFVKEPVEFRQQTFPTSNSELQELLVVMKDIQGMMKDFLAGNYVKLSKKPKSTLNETPES